VEGASRPPDQIPQSHHTHLAPYSLKETLSMEPGAMSLSLPCMSTASNTSWIDQVNTVQARKCQALPLGSSQVNRVRVLPRPPTS
jgi:hypothetical protein